MTWQPIETAPKDGTNVLVYANGSMEICFFGEGEEGGDAALIFPEDDTTVARWRVSWSTEPFDIFDKITHWMPPPEPPLLEEHLPVGK